MAEATEEARERADFPVEVELPEGSGTRVWRYGKLPATTAVRVRIVAADSDEARRLAAELGDGLDQALKETSPEVERADGAVASPAGETVLHVLVVVGDGVTPIPESPFLTGWAAGGDDHLVLPLLPRDAVPPALLPESLSLFNAGFWTDRIGEQVDAVLALAGLAPEERRIFVSYRQKEARELADQLFEALSWRHFDVFLDRVSIEPGVQFQRRLFDELAERAMVVILETKGILDSRWVVDELNFAKKYELGRLALHPDGGTMVPLLDDEFREAVPEADFDGEGKRLTAAALKRVVRRIVREHTRAHARRTYALRADLREALARFGVADVRVDANGHLHARSAASPEQRYVVAVTPRLAELDDFRRAHGTCEPEPCPTGVIVAPTLPGEPARLQRTEWLAKRSGIKVRDAGQIVALAEEIARGAALT
ncbi:MAG TPA: toll/interleukin-1 receptor domain-containing protein [Longimicrobium sp.]|nr:toll/interleukin-1 receptor domain-containing protein [Longimicrobium sp.]